MTRLRNLGSFFLSQSLLLQRPEFARKLLAGMIVVRAEYKYEMDGIEYLADSPHFDPISMGMLPPFYFTEINVDGDGHILDWRWVNPQVVKQNELDANHSDNEDG